MRSSTCPGCSQPWAARGCNADLCRGVAVSDMTTEQARDALREVMEYLSEEYWCAGWMIDLEQRLQTVIDRGTPGPFGMADALPAADFERLRDLRAKAGGWWVFDGDVEGRRRFVPDAEVAETP